MKAVRGLMMLVSLTVVLAQGRAAAAPVGSAFTYQGVVEKNGVGINGACSIKFTLYDALTGGSQVGAPNPNTLAVNPAKGLFTVTLDFGASAFNANNARWLEIAVQGPGDLSYTVLTPRQPLSPVPYALFALSAPGGGGLTLPFAGSASNAGNAFGVTNSNGSGTALSGIGGLTGVEGTGGFAGVYGHSTTEYGVYGETSANPSGAVRGHHFGSGPGVEGIGGSGNGVNGTSASGNGIYGTTFSSSIAAIYGINSGGGGPGVQGQSTSGFGVWGTSSSATGVQGQSTTGWGVYGSSAGANAGGVFGQTSVANATGTLGRNESSSGTGQAVFGYASSSAVGVLAVSEGNDGLSARSNAPNKSAVFGYTEQPSGYAGYFFNNSTGVALHAEGMAEVKVLKILGGADLAERFAGDAGAEPGTVMAIDPDRPGHVIESREAYCRRVAGVVSGARNLNAGITLGDDAEGGSTTALAMTGRVWVKADATSAPIHPGDLLTTGDRPGHAIVASDHDRAVGAILGKAMSSLERGTGHVLVLVNLQ